ncbi:MAG: histidine kinase N-terminal 7TM domain-containing protein [Haloarculaceae archaeon]
MESVQLPVAVHVALTAAFGGVAVFAVRNRQEPGARPFAVLMVAEMFWIGGYAVALVTTDAFWRLVLENVQWLGTATIHLWLLLFTLAYTGYDRYVTRRNVAVLLVPPALAIVAFATNSWHHLMFTDATVVVRNGLALMDFTYAPGFWVYSLYSYSVLLISFALLIRLVFVSDYLYADQSVLLGTGIVLPLAINVVDVAYLEQYVTIDVTPVALSITALCFGYALFRRRLFDLVPATRQLGRQSAIGQLDTGIVIVDTDNRVVYANRAAGDIFDCEPEETLGRRARSFVDDEWLDFDSEDALAEVDRGDRTYEIRTSEITDRHGREIGHTLVIHDVTARKERERRLASQREELATVNELNAVIRGVNQSLVSATSQTEITRAVCDRLADAALYEGVCVADLQTWSGGADRWHVAGDALTEGDGDPTDGGVGVAPPDLDAERIRPRDGEGFDGGPVLPVPASGEADAGEWTVVPVAHGRTVYGAIGLLTDRSDVSDRERAVLGELGELVGHAISAVESRRLFRAEDVVELTVAVDQRDDPLAAATGNGESRLEVIGVVPDEEGHHAFVEVTDGSRSDVREALADAGVDVRHVRENSSGDFLDVVVDERISLAPVVASDAHFVRGTVAEGEATYDVLVPSASDGRTLLDRFSEAFPSMDLRSKRERDRPFEGPDGIAPDRLDDLTDRQREALEAAYRAGYFEWPRDSNAEEVAESMDIASPTLHSHLRKAQRTLLEDLFERDGQS